MKLTDKELKRFWEKVDVKVRTIAGFGLLL